METEEIFIGRIKAPGISKKKGRTPAKDPKIQEIDRKLSSISNEITNNLENLDFLKYEFDVIQEFKNCLNENFA